jgi:hypothetical protein
VKLKITKKQRENLKKYHVSQEEKARRSRFHKGDWIIHKSSASPDSIPSKWRIEMMIDFFVEPYGTLLDSEKVITRKILTLGSGFKDINWGFNDQSTPFWKEIRLVSELNSTEQREVMTSLFSLEVKKW